MKKRLVRIGIGVAFTAALGCLGAGLIIGEAFYFYTAAEIAFVGVLLLSLHGAIRD